MGRAISTKLAVKIKWVEFIRDGQTVTRVLVFHPGEWLLEAGGQVLAGRLCAGCLMWLPYYGLYMSVLRPQHPSSIPEFNHCAG